MRDLYLLQRSEPFTINQRQEITVDFLLKKAPKIPCTVLSGCVICECEQIKGATVKAFNKHDLPIAHTHTDSDGNFVFDHVLPVGCYKIIATAKGYKVSEVCKVILKERIPSCICISLKVSDNADKSYVYGKVYGKNNLGLFNANVMLLDYEDPKTCLALTQTNCDGEFLFFGLPPNKYWLSASLDGYFLGQKIAVYLKNNEKACINLFMSCDTHSTLGTVSGRFDLQGETIQNYLAALYEIDAKGEFLIAAKETNSIGYYLFSNVKPGRYIVKLKNRTDFLSDIY